MDISTLKACCTARPFKVFAVNLSDGRSFPIPHPDFLMVSPVGNTVIAFRESGGFDIIDLDQITGVTVPEPPRRNRHASARHG